MRNIAIIGAGQAGLQLGLGLLKSGYKVTLLTERDSNEVLNGKIMSSQGMFDSALQYERQLGLDFWNKTCPQNESVTFTIASPRVPKVEVQWQGILQKPFQSVDQRIKFSKWLVEFEALGGCLVKEVVDLKTLDSIANAHDLTVVASGKGELSKIFQRDASRSFFSKSMRYLSCLYVHNMLPCESKPGVRPNIIPGVGEYFTMPGLSLGGACEMMLFEGVPGGPFDCWQDIVTPEQQLEKAVKLLNEFIPWEAERCRNLKLVDKNATLKGHYTPEVKRPTYQLSSGKFVLGIGDAVILNDPIAGQGANNSSKAANIYLNSILKKGQGQFDQMWMNATFNQVWLGARWSTQLSNLLLLPPPVHVIELLTAASYIPALANMLANGFDDPGNLFPWILKAEDTKQIVKRYSSGSYTEEQCFNVVGA